MTNITPVARVMTLTPAIATEYLARNPRNRKFSEKNYSKVLRAITNGEWVLNGEAVKIGNDGRVLDGQHRLRAVVESGISIETFIIEGLSAETQDTMDTGKSRNLADILTIRGHTSATTLSAILRRIYLYETHSLKVATVASYPTTNREVLEFFEANKWVESLISDARQTAYYAKLPGSLAGLLIHVFQTVDADDAEFFFDRLRTGEKLETTHAIYALRRALDILHKSKGATNQTYLAALTIKAWNKYRAGEAVGTLKFTAGGANPEQFPEPK